MEFEDEVELEASPSTTWELISDPLVLVSCVPGAEEVERVSDDVYRGTIKRGMAGISLSLEGEVTLTEQDPPEYLKADAQGEDSNTGSRVDAEAQMWLREGTDVTTMAYEIDMDFTGRLATLGARITKRFIQKDINMYFQNLQEQIEADEG